MRELMVKDVNFNGSMIRAAQDANNDIWVGVKWVCDGMGMSEAKQRAEKNRIQNDAVLIKGMKRFPLVNNGVKSDMLCIQLDYLPLWLGKIHVTERMKRESPDLAEKLITYQLKAKDALSNAFMRSNPPAVRTYDSEFAELNSKIDKLYGDMGKLANIILSYNHKEELLADREPVKMIVEAVEENPYTTWKTKVSTDLLEPIMEYNKHFASKKNLLSHVYKTMNRKYGIVWEQEIKDYSNRNNFDRNVSKLEIVYDNDTFRSIFESILTDMKFNNAVSDDIDVIISPLAAKYQDNSNANMTTYRRVYKYMENNLGVSWKNNETRYINRHGKKNFSRKNMIVSNKHLMKKFRTSVDELLVG